MTSSNDLRSIQSTSDPLITYREAMRDLTELLATLQPEQWSLPIPCPGWTVADIAAHLIDLDSMAMGAPSIEHEPNWNSLPHVTSPSNQFTERGVDYRRGTPPTVLLDQLTSTSESLFNYISRNSVSVKVPWVKDELPTDLFLSMRAFDVWVHEQDIRTTINEPGSLNSDAARASAQRMFASIPFIWGKKVGAPINSTLTLTVTGPGVEGSLSATVGPDGKALLIDHVDSSENQVTMSWPDFVAAFTGRIAPEESISRAQTQGELARSFVSLLASTP